MTVSTIKVCLSADCKRVWDCVTSLENYAWRSDLDRIVILNEKQFEEYTKDHHKTLFTITLKEQYKRWEFDMENDLMKGHWIGVFADKQGQTEVEFIEQVSAKKLFMKPFVKGFLKKQQAAYINDLKRVLNCECY